MDGASTKEIIRVVKMCPTQALGLCLYKNLSSENKTDENNTVIPQDMPEIRVMENGPIVFHGNFHIINSDGKELRSMKIQSICRCGASDNMPYCERTHRKTGFTGK